MRIGQACGHVEHEGVVKLAHLVGHIDVLAASLDHDLPDKRGGARTGGHANHERVMVSLEFVGLMYRAETERAAVLKVRNEMEPRDLSSI